MAQDGLPSVKVEAKQPVERYSICHIVPGEEDTTNDPEPSSINNLPEQVGFFINYKNTLPAPFYEQPPQPESRSFLEDDDTEPFGNSGTFGESPGSNQSDLKISLKEAASNIEDEVETSLLPQQRGEIENMRRQLELTEGLLKAKQTELEQLEKKHNEAVNFFEKKLQMKDCETALLKEKINTGMTKREEEWKEEEEKWKDQISKLHSELEKAKKERNEANKEKNEANKEKNEANKEKNEAKKEKDKARREKDEATRKLDAIFQLASPQGVKRKGEYVERFSSQDVGSSIAVKREPEDPTGVKREAEEEESDGASFWNM